MISICFPVGQTTSFSNVSASMAKKSTKSHLVDTVGLGRFCHYGSGLQWRRHKAGQSDRRLTMKLERSVDLSIGLLEGIANAEDTWIDSLVNDGLNIQFITVIPNGLLLFHGIKDWGSAALEEDVRNKLRKRLARGNCMPVSNKPPWSEFKQYILSILTE